MFQKSHRSYISIIIFIFTLVGCQQLSQQNKEIKPSSSSDNSNEIDVVNGYPENVSSYIEESYPSSITNDIVPTSTFLNPLPDKAILIAAIYSKSLKSNLTNSLVYLTPAVGVNKNELYPILGGPRPDIGDVLGLTDSLGNLVLTDITPGNYFMIVAYPPDWAIALESENSNKELLITIEGGQLYKMGKIFIP